MGIALHARLLEPCSLDFVRNSLGLRNSINIGLITNCHTSFTKEHNLPICSLQFCTCSRLLTLGATSEKNRRQQQEVSQEDNDKNKK